MLSDLPPLKKFNVYNEYGDILLVTSSRYIASWYQSMYNMKESSKLFRIKVGHESNTEPFEELHE